MEQSLWLNDTTDNLKFQEVNSEHVNTKKKQNSLKNFLVIF